LPDTVTPTSFEGAASTLAGAAADGRAVRIVGGATKLGWGSRCEPSLLLRTAGLDQTLEHNSGDLTAIFAAGVPLARAQAELGEHGQRLAIDPPLGAGGSGAQDATIGGVFATGDCGPLRHRYGLPRDLILGATIALSDGTIARTGGKVIKNVAGYDLAKLFTGSFGTLGLILSVSVRLHPLPQQTATAMGAAGAARALRDAAVSLSRAPLELEALDVAWRGGRGGLLAQAAGPEALRRCRRAAELMRGAGLRAVEVTDEDGALWARQRAGQRSGGRALVRVASRPTELPAVLAAADAGAATLVGRAAHGTYYLELEPEAIGAVRSQLPREAVMVVLDLPAGAAEVDRWNRPEDAALSLMRSVKERFDPAGVCNPGLFVGGI
jgi:glycolate oxidase FAD binding subunit